MDKLSRKNYQLACTLMWQDINDPIIDKALHNIVNHGILSIYHISIKVMAVESISTRNIIGQVKQNKLSADMHINEGDGMPRLFELIIISLAPIQSGETMKPIYSQGKGRTGKLVWAFKIMLKGDSKQDAMRMESTPLRRTAEKEGEILSSLSQRTKNKTYDHLY